MNQDKQLSLLAKKQTPESLHEYWILRNQIYGAEFTPAQKAHHEAFELQERIILKMLRGISLGRVLEIGCGNGRITKLLIHGHDVDQWDAYDISPIAVQLALRNITRRGFTAQVGSFSSITNHYETSIASEVLMHIHPSVIVPSINKLLFHTNRLFFHVDWHKPLGGSHKAHCFHHDYPAIYKSLGVDYDVTQFSADQAIFRVWL